MNPLFLYLYFAALILLTSCGNSARPLVQDTPKDKALVVTATLTGLDAADTTRPGVAYSVVCGAAGSVTGTNAKAANGSVNVTFTDSSLKDGASCVLKAVVSATVTYRSDATKITTRTLAATMTKAKQPDQQQIAVTTTADDGKCATFDTATYACGN